MRDAAALSPALSPALEAFDSVAARFDMRFGARRTVTAQLLRPGAPALLVLFGTFCPGQVMVQIARGDARAALPRRSRGAVPARHGGREFEVRYHSAGELADAMGPWFRLTRRIGVGVLVPPSAAEPWISRHPALVRTLEQMDRVLARPFAPLGDHLLYWLERTAVPCDSAGDDPVLTGT